MGVISVNHQFLTLDYVRFHCVNQFHFQVIRTVRKLLISFFRQGS